MKKKTELIGIRTTKEIKNYIETEADKREWTVSKTAERMLEEYIAIQTKKRREEEGKL